VKRIAGFQETRGVDEHRLMPVVGIDAQETLPSGLSLGCNDTQPLADQLVEQRRLPNVRKPDDSADASPELGGSGDSVLGHE
jgi:hypothetical protein